MRFKPFKWSHVLYKEWGKLNSKYHLDTYELGLSKGQTSKYTPEDYDHINIWTKSEDNESVLIRVCNFPTYFFVDLPSPKTAKVGGSWSKSKAIKYMTDKIASFGRYVEKPVLIEYLDEDRNIITFESSMERPFVKIHMRSRNAMQEIVKRLSKTVSCLQHDYDNTTIMKFYVSLGLDPCTTIEVDESLLLEVPENLRYSIIQEYIVDYNDIFVAEVPLVSKLREACIDIEVASDDKNKFPLSSIIYNEVYMISIIDRTVNGAINAKYCICSTNYMGIPEDYEVILCADEEEVLDTFNKYMREIDPDIISGHNVVNFDINYMMQRCEIWQLPAESTGCSWLNLGRSNVNYTSYKAPFEKKYKKGSKKGPGKMQMATVVSEGRVIVDILFYAQSQGLHNTLKDLTLETLSQTFLGKGKHEVGKNMFEYYDAIREDPDDETNQENIFKLMGYCVQDTNLVVELEDKLSVWLSMEENANVKKIGPEDVLSKGAIAQGTCMLLYYADKLGILAVPRSDTIDGFKGALVQDPRSGVYERLTTLDFSSLYPSIIIENNVSPDTLVRPKNRHEYEGMKTRVFHPDEVRDILDEDGNPTGETKTEIFEYEFLDKSERVGLLPTILRTILAYRKTYKNEMEKHEEGTLDWTICNQKQLAAKVSANSLYGYLGFKHNKYNLIEGSRVTTFCGREMITEVANMIIDELEGEIIYGDTDSVMVDIPQVKSNKDCYYWGVKMADMINGHKADKKDAYGVEYGYERKPMFGSDIKIEYEKSMAMICIQKKYYVAWYIDKNGEYVKNKDGTNKLYAKGVCMVKKKTPSYLVRLYGLLSNTILGGDEFNIVAGHVIDTVYDIMEGGVDEKEFIMMMGVGNSPRSPTKFLSDRMNKLGRPLDVGNRVKTLKVSNPIGYEDVPYTKLKEGQKLILYDELHDPHEEGHVYTLDYEKYVKDMRNAISMLTNICYPSIKEYRDKPGMVTLSKYNVNGRQMKTHHYIDDIVWFAYQAYNCRYNDGERVYEDREALKYVIEDALVASGYATYDEE